RPGTRGHGKELLRSVQTFDVRRGAAPVQARGETDWHNGTLMDRTGSEDQPPLPAALAAVMAMLGAGAMVGGGVVAGRFAHRGVRLSLIVGSSLLALPALLAMTALNRTPFRETLRLRGGGQRTLLLAAALGGSLWILSLGLLELQTVVWPPPEGYIEQFRALHEQLRARNALDWLFSLLAIAAMPALCEELLVRGVVLPSFRPALGPTLALGASSLVFAGIHFDVYRFAFTFAAGLVLGPIRPLADPP